MKIYCPDCGSPNSYVSKKPNFCQNCGKSFGDSKASTPMPKPELSPGIRVREEDQIEELEFEEVPEINGLDVEIESGRIEGVQMGNIVGSVEPREQNNNPKGAPKKKGRKPSKRTLKNQADKFFKDFQKEAGTRGRPNSE
jgi:hypothetical protein